MLKARRDAMKDDVVGFAQELVRTPSPSFQERGVAAIVEAGMKSAGFDNIFTDDAGNVIGVMYGRENGPNLLLLSHMDSCPHDASAWKRHPFSGEISDGRLWGLSASDCKGGLAAQIFAAALLRRAILPLQGSLIVAATVAEEKWGSIGVRALMQRTLPALGLEPAYAVLGEPTGLGIYYGHDGWMEIDACIRGANPFHVGDAAEAVARRLGSRPWAAEGGKSAEFHVQNLSYAQSEGLRRATIRMARRLSVPENVARVLEQVKSDALEVATSTGAVAVDVAVHEESQMLYTGHTTVARHVLSAWETDPFCPLMERTRHALSAAGLEAKPGKWRLGKAGMGTAGGVLMRDFSVPAIGYGPGDEDVAHGPDEYAETDAIAEATLGTAVIAHALVGVPVYGWTSDEI